MSRSAADVGRGLEPAREARPIAPGERIHVVGVAGAGASAAALLAHHAGARVSGCDAGGPSPYSAALEDAGIPLAWSHDPAHVTGVEGPVVDRLAVTKALTAVSPDHPELRAAVGANVPVEAWQQVVADVAAGAGQRLIAVAGTHGKSTTTGWLAHALIAGGRDPSAFVGALLDGALTGGRPATSRWGKGDAFVVEADEYAGNFDPYRPSVAVLLNAEWDHPDVFADEDAVLDAFEGWLRRAGEGGTAPTLVANISDAGVRRLVERLMDWPGRLVTVSLDDDPAPSAGTALGPATAIRARLNDDGGGRTRLEVAMPEGGTQQFRVGLAGRHNAANALAVIGAAYVLDVPAAAVVESIGNFPGVGRRLELKGEAAGVVVLDDYGHHPTAIALTIEAVRQRYPGRRLWAVYEPLTFHRTAEMLDRFADVLAAADAVAIADIWAGRDPDTTITSSRALAQAVSRRGRAPAEAPGSVEATADYLAGHVQPGDVVLVMGGGRSYVVADRLLRLLGADQSAGSAGEAR